MWENKKYAKNGQHHLVDTRIISSIIDAGKINKNDTVLEFGSGSGYLTLEISKSAKYVYAYEIDYDLYIKARETCKNASNVRIINQDFFKNCITEFDLFISNIPYQYSNRIIKWLSVRKFSRAVIMVQREFANKLMAQPNDSSYSAISVIAQYCFEIESLFLVTSDAFLPVPRVESQVIKPIPKNNLIVKEVMNTIELLFRSRNRVIDMNYSNREKLKRISELSVKEIIEISMKKLNFKTKLCK